MSGQEPCGLCGERGKGWIIGQGQVLLLRGFLPLLCWDSWFCVHRWAAFWAKLVSDTRWASSIPGAQAEDQESESLKFLALQRLKPSAPTWCKPHVRVQVNTDTQKCCIKLPLGYVYKAHVENARIPKYGVSQISHRQPGLDNLRWICGERLLRMEPWIQGVGC